MSFSDVASQDDDGIFLTIFSNAMSNSP